MVGVSFRATHNQWGLAILKVEDLNPISPSIFEIQLQVILELSFKFWSGARMTLRGENITT